MYSSDEDNENYLEKREELGLKPPRRLRPVEPRCCATCKWLVMGDGSSSCLRRDGPVFDNGDMRFWFWLCKGYARTGK